MDLLVSFPDALSKHGYATQVAYADVVGREGDVSHEELAYLGVRDVRGGHEVLKEVGVDVVLMGKYTP